MSCAASPAGLLAVEMPTDLFVASAILVGVLTLAFIVLLIIRHRLGPGASRPHLSTTDLTAEQLEKMREAGTITRAEYGVMREILIGRELARMGRNEAMANDETKTNDEAP
jgi:hypothetical protein